MRPSVPAEVFFENFVEAVRHFDIAVFFHSRGRAGALLQKQPHFPDRRIGFFIEQLVIFFQVVALADEDIVAEKLPEYFAFLFLQPETGFHAGVIVLEIEGGLFRHYFDYIIDGVVHGFESELEYRSREYMVVFIRHDAGVHVRIFFYGL